MWERNGETAGLNHPYRPMKDEVNIRVHEESSESKKRGAQGGKSIYYSRGHADEVIAKLES